MATTSVSLGEHWEAFLRAQVESGRYATISEVLRESLRQMELRESRIAALRAAIQEGIDSGEPAPVNFNDIMRDARAEYARRQAKA